MAHPLTHPEAPHTIRRCKNIVVCCDGTGNQFGPDNSNVVRLYTALCVDNDQVAYYHPGVGTMGAPNRQTKLGRNWSKLMGLAFAAGFRDNVLDAYRYLMETYDDGDHIFLFGFSRGAYTARALAGMIHGYGLLCRGNRAIFPMSGTTLRDRSPASMTGMPRCPAIRSKRQSTPPKPSNTPSPTPT